MYVCVVVVVVCVSVCMWEGGGGIMLNLAQLDIGVYLLSQSYAILLTTGVESTSEGMPASVSMVSLTYLVAFSSLAHSSF